MMLTKDGHKGYLFNMMIRGLQHMNTHTKAYSERDRERRGSGVGGGEGRERGGGDTEREKERAQKKNRASVAGDDTSTPFAMNKVIRGRCRCRCSDGELCGTISLSLRDERSVCARA